MRPYNRLTQVRMIVVDWDDMISLPSDIELLVFSILGTFKSACVVRRDNIFSSPLRLPTLLEGCPLYFEKMPETGDDRFTDLFEKLPRSEPCELFLLSSNQADVRCAISSGWLAQHLATSDDLQLIGDLLERCKNAQAERQQVRRLIAY